MKIIILTGYSGAGKSMALRYVEEQGYYCVDNLPALLLTRLVEEARRSRRNKIAVVIDSRGRGFMRGLNADLDVLKSRHELRIVFFDATLAVVTKRFQEVRLRHPLALTGTIRQGYETERSLLAGLRQRADLVVDTSVLSVHSLRILIRKYLTGGSSAEPEIHLMSFGFKYGLPAEADVVLDVRLLANPYFEAGLKKKSGKSAGVRRFILRHAGAKRFLKYTAGYVGELLEGYRGKGKPFVTIAFGCTGGRHRSVFVAEKLGKVLKRKYKRTRIMHRDIALG